MAANGGSPGNREVNSSVYQFNNEGQLQLVKRVGGMKDDKRTCVCCNEKAVNLSYVMLSKMNYITCMTLSAQVIYNMDIRLCACVEEISSTITCNDYYMHNPTSLLQVQYILTTGASDVVAFQSPTSGAGEWYLVFSSREDSEGNPNVNSPVLKWNGAEFQQAQVITQCSVIVYYVS